MEPFIYLETGSQDPAYNLAFEEYVLQRRHKGTYLILWQNANTVVIGRNQIAESEIQRTFIDAHHIRVVRRNTGGGAVYHDLGNLNYSFITDAGDVSRLNMARFAGLIIEALSAMGIRAEASGRNDILIDGHKVSGTAQQISGTRILHHGTLLFDSDLDMVSGALRADPEKFRSKSTRSVRSRVGNIRDFLPADRTRPEFWKELKHFFLADGAAQADLSPEELAAVNELKCRKYDTWEWNFGEAPQYDLSRKRRWPGGTLEIRVQLERDQVTGIAFFGDFLAPRPLDEITAALTGLPFDPAAFSAVLTAEAVARSFGSITKDELLSTIFH